MLQGLLHNSLAKAELFFLIAAVLIWDFIVCALDLQFASKNNL
jgi:hypothetical protein